MPTYDEIIKKVRKAGPEPKIGEFPDLENPADEENQVPGIDIPAPLRKVAKKPPLPQQVSNK